MMEESWWPKKEKVFGIWSSVASGKVTVDRVECRVLNSIPNRGYSACLFKYHFEAMIFAMAYADAVSMRKNNFSHIKF
jgi:hypothetical protein